MNLISDLISDSISIEGYKITKYVNLFGKCLKLDDFQFISSLNLSNNNIPPD